MDRLLYTNFRCISRHLALVFLWTAGFLLGIFLGLFTRDRIPFFVYADFFKAKVSVYQLLFFRFLPLFACVISYRILQQSVFLLTIFLKAFVFAFTVAFLVSEFGSSAWLFSCLLFLGDGLCFFVYWLIWLHSPSLSFRCIKLTVLIASAAIVLITFFDCVFVAPFVAKLI